MKVVEIADTPRSNVGRHLPKDTLQDQFSQHTGVGMNTEVEQSVGGEQDDLQPGAPEPRGQLSPLPYTGGGSLNSFITLTLNILPGLCGMKL